MTIRHIPNMLSIARILLSLLLLCTGVFSPLFFILYLCCGISDFLDGYIARKTNSVSPSGAALDSVADAVFFGVILWLFIPRLLWPGWLLGWIGLIILIRLVSLAVGYVKFRSVAFIHTCANKATGFLVFCLPLFYCWMDSTLAMGFVCAVASVSAIEELLINGTSRTLMRDRKSIFESPDGDKAA
ncbi:MAG: CDP-alcohol phosphatidyltransferase family protein [Eubacteriales bacterium]|nr:CDP-alcohol phosphatidyltransferase family protein [Eubacteriales bacterium]